MDEYQLILFEKDRLVKVRKNSGQSPGTDELPPWTFHSRNTIWRTDENVPIPIRAARGEQIKLQILQHLRAQ